MVQQDITCPHLLLIYFLNINGTNWHSLHLFLNIKKKKIKVSCQTMTFFQLESSIHANITVHIRIYIYSAVLLWSKIFLLSSLNYTASRFRLISNLPSQCLNPTPCDGQKLSLFPLTCILYEMMYVNSNSVYSWFTKTANFSLCWLLPFEKLSLLRHCQRVLRDEESADRSE